MRLVRFKANSWHSEKQFVLFDSEFSSLSIFSGVMFSLNYTCENDDDNDFNLMWVVFNDFVQNRSRA